MYRVIVTEDEPAALRHICTLIELKCPEFEVVKTADNGQGALDLLENTDTDVLITDVKMPIMDGVTLARKVKDRYPQIITLIISGYQEFEYARAAIQTGVCDYILKPVKPSAFQASMRMIQGCLDELYYSKRNKILREMCMGKTDIEKQKDFYRVFSKEEYYAALLRKNGLPRRFVNSIETEIFSVKDEQMAVYGRDEREALYLLPKDFLLSGSFFRLMTHMAEKEKRTADYYTLVLLEDPLKPKELPDAVRRLYQTLDASLVIGKDQVVPVNDKQERKQQKQEYNSGLERLNILVKEGNRRQIREEVKGCFAKWEQEERTQLWVEEKVRELFSLFRRQNMLWESVDTYEYFLDEAFYFASDMQELSDNILQIFSENFEEEARRIKIDTPEFFEKILKYMKENLTDPLSPQSISHVFGISQTYLSRLFRKYCEQSFNRVLNSFRIEKAKEIMSGNPELFIKDAAAMVGFSDQFYFSRIFRTVTGISPSEYIEKAVRDKNSLNKGENDAIS